MRDPKAMEEAFSKAALPWLMLAGIGIILVFIGGGFTDLSLILLLLAAAAFTLGRVSITQNWPWIRTLNERRRMGREVLVQMDPAEVGDVRAIIEDKRKIEAIKRVRAVTQAGLAEAKEAVDILDDFGDNWKKVEQS